MNPRNLKHRLSNLTSIFTRTRKQQAGSPHAPPEMRSVDHRLLVINAELREVKYRLLTIERRLSVIRATEQ